MLRKWCPVLIKLDLVQHLSLFPHITGRQTLSLVQTVVKGEWFLDQIGLKLGLDFVLVKSKSWFEVLKVKGLQCVEPLLFIFVALNEHSDPCNTLWNNTLREDSLYRAAERETANQQASLSCLTGMNLENKWNHFADQTGNFYTSVVLLREPDGVVQRLGLASSWARPPCQDNVGHCQTGPSEWSPTLVCTWIMVIYISITGSGWEN